MRKNPLYNESNMYAIYKRYTFEASLGSNNIVYLTTHNHYLGRIVLKQFWKPKWVATFHAQVPLSEITELYEEYLGYLYEGQYYPIELETDTFFLVTLPDDIITKNNLKVAMPRDFPNIVELPRSGNEVIIKVRKTIYPAIHYEYEDIK